MASSDSGAWAVAKMARLDKKRLWGANAGETVTVKRSVVTYDEDFEEVTETETETLANVLFGTPSADDISDAERLHGMRAQYTLAIPQEYDKPLRDCLIVRDADGSEWKVIIDKPPVPPMLTPTAWNRECVVGVEHG